MRILFYCTLIAFTWVSCKHDVKEPPEQTRTIDIYVDNKVSTNGDGSSSAPFNTIQRALDHAAAGQTILVRNGTYQEAITIDKNQIALLAEENVVLQSDQIGAVIHVTGDGVEVNGFEIANSASDDMGAIHVDQVSSADLIDNDIHHNPNAAAYWLNATSDVTIDGGQLVDNRGGIRIEGTTNNLLIQNIEISSSQIVLSQQGSPEESSQYFGIINGWEPVGGDNWVFDNVTIRGTVTYGIELRSRSETYPQENPLTNLVIRNCLLEQNGFGYAADGWPSTDYPPVYYYGNVLIQGLNGVIVENSIFRDGGDWGIDFYKTDNIIVRNNIFANNGVQTLHTEIGDGLEVNGGRNNKVFNNVFYNNPNQGLFLSYLIETQGELHNPTTLVANNIGWNNGADLSIFGPTQDSPYQGFFATHDLYNNLFGTRGIWGPLNEQGTINQNPEFVDPDRNNFELQNSSPAIDAGWEGDADLPSSDFIGNTRPSGNGPDLGIFEY